MAVQPLHHRPPQLAAASGLVYHIRRLPICWPLTSGSVGSRTAAHGIVGTAAAAACPTCRRSALAATGALSTAAAAAAALDATPVPAPLSAAAAAAESMSDPAAAVGDAAESKAAAKAAAQAAYAAGGSTLRTKRPPGLVKRSVAMHVGYVGTAFNGYDAAARLLRETAAPDGAYPQGAAHTAVAVSTTPAAAAAVVRGGLLHTIPGQGGGLAAGPAAAAAGLQVNRRLPAAQPQPESVGAHNGAAAAATVTPAVALPGADSTTVEGVLETAVFEAGLIAESNFGDLHKVKWTRNSRTDKGVHSLATVVGLRVLLPGDERWETDPEGLELVQQLNSRLPHTVRVFSVQRVNKKFNARRFCYDRTYDYYLPAHILGLQPPNTAADTAATGDGGGSDGSAASSLSSAAADAAVLARFRAALQLYVGNHPFHNYTPRRKEYSRTIEEEQRGMRERQQQQRQQEQEGRPATATVDPSHDEAAPAPPPAAAAATVGAGGAEARSDAGQIAATAVADSSGAAGQQQQQQREQDGEDDVVAAAPAAAGISSGDDDGYTAEEEEEEEGVASRAPKRGAGPASASARRGGGPLEEDDDVDDEEEDGLTPSTSTSSGSGDEGVAALGSAAAGDDERLWMQSCRWLPHDEHAPSDYRVTVRHFRSITSFTADDPVQLVPGGVPCLRLRVQGMSFMLNQIRHMVGGAIVVARGMIPIELLAASLGKNARVTVPRAPPHTLILAESTFPPFRKVNGEEARVAQWSGERLKLRQGGKASMEQFRRQVLDAALSDLLLHPDWAVFEAKLPRYCWPEEQRAEVIAQHARWTAWRAERAKQRQADTEAAEPAAASSQTGAAGDTQPQPAVR